MGNRKLRVGVDTGGTFTDIVALTDEGAVYRAKVLSTPDDFSRGILSGLKEILQRSNVDAGQLGDFVHGTTVATNAVLEGTGPATGLLTTGGFRDVLEIGRCRWDGDIFDLTWQKPACLIPRDLRRDVPERINAKGEIVHSLDESLVRTELRALRDAGVSTLAVCLLNAYANPIHERRIAEIAAIEVPEIEISLSSDVLNEIREFERTSTTAVNAYLSPIVDGYLAHLQGGLTSLGYGGEVLVMQSSGAVMSARTARRRSVNIVESGPAAGVLAAANLAKQSGEHGVIAFDMGGTTAKASLIENGRWFTALEYCVGGGMNRAGGHGGGGHVLRVPSIDIAEVGSGGGSIAWIDAGGMLKVGPRSAGALPGPACYDMGGEEPTVTDAYAALGYLNPHEIAGGSKRISIERAHATIESKIAQPLGLSVADAAHAIYTIATSNIIRAVRAVTVERGRDAAGYGLVAFGGAGPMHAAELAQAMGLSRVIVPPCSGLFSAVGLLCADLAQERSRTVLRGLNEINDSLTTLINSALAEIEAQAKDDLAGFKAIGEVVITRTATLHYFGQSHELVIDVPAGTLTATDVRDLAFRFCDAHQRTYGHSEHVSRVELVSLRAKAAHPLDTPSFRNLGKQVRAQGEARSRKAYFGLAHGWAECPVVTREQVRKQSCIGPVIIEEFDSTVLIPPSASASVNEHGSIVITFPASKTRTAQHSKSPVNLELFSNALNSIADEMAVALTRTARSLGVKDARDFSIAICNPDGESVSSGVGLAIHLGAIPSALAAVKAHFKSDFEPGDVIFTNDPYSGGMHLPDIFVIKPLVLDGALLGFAAVVAHMADIGGRVPGGNAADSVSIHQEGLRIPPIKLYRRGRLSEDWIALVRANVRQPDMVIGDIFAEVAACTAAEREFIQLVQWYGKDALLTHMNELIAHGERMARTALTHFNPGSYRFIDHLDDDGLGGEPVQIKVHLEIGKEKIRVDLAGTADQVRGAINAPLCVTRSTVAYLVATMIPGELPNSAGISRVFELAVPEGSIANMLFPAACAARAVTAYRVLDALFGALAQAMPNRIPAAGDGGPSILSVGGEDTAGASFVLMEVVSGASGGRPDRDGMEGVASPFANTQNTSIEMIEASLPLRVEHYGFVAGSSGNGQYRGGMALRRDTRFLGKRGVLQIRADRSRLHPWGLAGGGEGSCSEAWLEHADGSRERLAGKVVIEIQNGDKWSFTTASGAGWGHPSQRNPSAVIRDLREGRLLLDAAARIYPHATRNGSTP